MLPKLTNFTHRSDAVSTLFHGAHDPEISETNLGAINKYESVLGERIPFPDERKRKSSEQVYKYTQ